MTAQKTRRRAATWLATATASLVALSGLALAPTAALAEPVSGVTVTAVNGAAPNAKWPNVAVNAGSELTLAGTFPESFGNSTASAGYLQWCLKPAEGERPDRSACDSATGQWLSSVDLGAPYNIPATGTVTEGVWTFTAKITPPRSIAGTECGADGAGECGIYFQPDRRFDSAINTYDQFIPIRFASNLGEAEAVTADVVKHPTDATLLQVNAAATGITFEKLGQNTDSGSANAGAYFALVERGTYLGTTMDNAIAMNYAYVPPTAIAAATTLQVPIADLDPAKSYEVVSWRAHGNPSAERYLGAADFSIPTTSTVAFHYGTARYNAGNLARVTVTSPTDVTPTGRATLRVAGQTYAANLVNGKASIKLTKPVKVGTHTASVTFTNQAGGALYASSKAENKLKVIKATPRVSAKISSSTVKTNRNARVSVAVTIPGSLGAKASKFSVQVYDGKKRIKSARLNSYGKVNVTLPKLKAGTHKIKVRVSSTTNTNVAYSATKTLRAVRS